MEGKEHQKQKHDSHKGKPHHLQDMDFKDTDEEGGLRLIVRIAGIDLDGRKPISRSLTKIKGIGVRMGKAIATAFEKSTSIPASQKTGMLSEEESKKLEEVVYHPEKSGVPAWLLNKRKDFFTGEDRHLVMSDWDLSIRSDIQLMTETKSYKGLRHAWGLPVRGQRTKSTHRGKGTVVGVIRKDAAKAMAPAKKDSGPAAKKEEKKK